MGKALTYSGFAISTILIVLAFVTAKNYSQLIIAVILYPLLAYFALKILPRRNGKAPTITIQIPQRTARIEEEVRREKVYVADLDKRTFIKLIGTAGISFFLFSLLGRRVESLLFGQTFNTGLNTNNAVVPANQSPQASQPLEGYKISEIDDNIVSYYGFTNQNGAWMIMKEDTQTSSFRYTKGESNFSSNWKSRENLKYDYYYNLF
jgi:hypothetical protein